MGLFSWLKKIKYKPEPEPVKETVITSEDPQIYIAKLCMERGEQVIANYKKNPNGTWTIDIF